MRTKRRILLAILLASVLAIFTSFLLRPTEPTYQGIRLTVWLQKQNGQWDDAGREKAETAIRTIGTDAIPTLLRLLQEKDSRLALKLKPLFDRFKNSKDYFVPAQSRNQWALNGFWILGADAKDAVPALIKILENDDSARTRGNAAYALGFIGPVAKEAVPALIRSVTSTNRPAHGMLFDAFKQTAPEPVAIRALGQIHADPSLVIPVLLMCMTNTNGVIAYTAINAIGDFGPAAQQAIPILMAEATNTSSRLRFYAMRNLGQIRSQPDLVVPFLNGFLTNSTVGARSSAATGLGFFGADAKPALSNVLELLYDTNFSVRASALEAASLIDFQNESVLRAIGQGLHNTNYGVRLAAAKSISRAGPSAKPLVPDLLTALEDRHPDAPDVQAALEAALKKIDPEAATKAGIR